MTASSSSSSATGFGSASVGVTNGFGAVKESTDQSTITTAETSKPSVFGGGFGAVSSGFGAAAKTSGFGAVSTTASSSGFGSVVNNKSTTIPPADNNDDDDGEEDENKSKDSPAKNNGSGPSSAAAPDLFPSTATVDTNNGEENEICLFEVLAKLYKMVPEVKEDDAVKMDNKGDVPSVPSSSGRFGDVKKEDDDKNNNNKEETNSSESKDAVQDNEKDGSPPKLVRKEAGVGNVRVLKRKNNSNEEENQPNQCSGRVVQRQKGSNSLILNVRLIPKQCKVLRPGEKFVQLNAPSKDGTLESFLFRVKATEDADKLAKHLENMLEGVNES